MGVDVVNRADRLERNLGPTFKVIYDGWILASIDSHDYSHHGDAWNRPEGLDDLDLGTPIRDDIIDDQHSSARLEPSADEAALLAVCLLDLSVERVLLVHAEPLGERDYGSGRDWDRLICRAEYEVEGSGAELAHDLVRVALPQLAECLTVRDGSEVNEVRRPSPAFQLEIACQECSATTEHGNKIWLLCLASRHGYLSGLSGGANHDEPHESNLVIALGGRSGIALPEDEARNRARLLSHDRETLERPSLHIDYR
jgi:hypothetical protein